MAGPGSLTGSAPLSADEGSIDYRAVGLRVGLEVHQQLLTEKKLFCHCPAGRYTETHDGAVLRHMRPTLSELGEYDGTALMEYKTRKRIVYLLNKENVCTYEMDDTPPFLVNREAVEISVELCLLLGCDIVDELHIARKQYLDGSIPTGFQRTAIVGVNGGIPFRGRRLSIIQVSLEEDSCREVLDRGHLVVWRTDRLGMPLIETVTGPDLRTPEEVEEAILLVGLVCRSSGRVRVGLGASRQDVNVSVRGGRRVEIKGVPQAWRARRLVHGEAVRQVQLLRLRDALRENGFRSEDDIRMDHRAVTLELREARLPVLRAESWERFVAAERSRPDLELGEGPFCVRAIRLRGLAGVMGYPVQPGRTFGHEVAGRVRVIATLDQPPVLFHSDAWPEEGAEDLERIRALLGAGEEDGVVVVWGPEADTLTAAEEIRARLVEALEGVPAETRQPLADGGTDFERILPGPDRMYPDTDSPPEPLGRTWVGRIQERLPSPPWERFERYGKAGVPAPTVRYLIRRGGADRVDAVVAEVGADLRRAAIFFGEEWKAFRRRGLAVEAIPRETWIALFERFGRWPASWEKRASIVERLCEDPGADLDRALEESGVGDPPEGWEGWVAGVTLETVGGRAGSAEGLVRFAMGRVMARLRGRVEGRAVAKRVREVVEGRTAGADLGGGVPRESRNAAEPPPGMGETGEGL